MSLSSKEIDFFIQICYNVDIFRVMSKGIVKMTETTKIILGKYQVRKSKKQKRAFASYIEQIATEEGYSYKVEKGLFGAENLVVGDPSNAKVVYTAHYDTAPMLPFPNFITPKNLGIYLLYNVAIVLGFLTVAFVIGAIFGAIFAVANIDIYFAVLIGFCVYFALFILLFAGPANKHTANDNTSGVTLLIDIMKELPKERHGEVAFIFFDLEESGLFGSMSYASKHNKEMKNRLLLNFDCVSDGNNMLLILRQGAKIHRQAIETAFAAKDGFNVEVADANVFYPSDQANFHCGVGVASLRSTKKGLLYMNRIHTHRDVIYQEENIEFFKNGAIELPTLL